MAAAESTPPSVSVTSPGAGATVSGALNVAASASDNRGVSGVQFKLDGQDLGAEDTSAPYSVSWNTTTSTDGAHTLTAVARDAAGNSATSQVVSVTVDNVPAPDTQAPSAPTGVSATGGVQQVALSWSAASDNVGVVRYNVHRSTVSGFTPSAANRVAQPTGTSYTDSGLAAGTYFYKVTAEDAAVNVGPSSAQASAIASPPADTQAPTVPAGVSATGGLEQVALNWSAASDNVGVVRYNVHRSTVSGFTPSAGNRVAQPTGTSYTDIGLAPGTYYYKVTAQDAAANVSAASAQVNALAAAEQTPPSVSMTSPTAGATLAGTATVAANASDNRGVASVQFRVDDQNLGAADTSAPYSLPWNTTTSTEGAHTVTAVARDAAGNSATSQQLAVTVDNVPAPDTQAPSVPAGVSASDGLEQVVVSWSAASDNVDVWHYNLHRSTVAGFTPSTANRVAQPTGTSYTDSALPAGRYYYRVTAEDAASNVSAVSAEVNAVAGAEQTPPSVSLTSPGAGATVTGTATVAASASDNRGVSGVQFKLDGQNLGAEDTSAPYSVPWNTMSAATGAHAVTAIARDAAGNKASAGDVSVTVTRTTTKSRGKKKNQETVTPLTDPVAPSLTLLDTPTVQDSGVIYLAVRASSAGRVVGTVKRVGSSRKARRIWRMTRAVKRGRNRVRFSTRGWKHARYRVTVRVFDGPRLVSKPVRLRVAVLDAGPVRVARLRF